MTDRQTSQEVASKAEWGADPEFFGPRHAHREGRILSALRRAAPSPGPHLECAAGVGSLSRVLAADGREVIAADRSLRSLAVLRRTIGRSQTIHPVVVDITALPFPDLVFASISSAETLEHIDDDARAAAELARTLRERGVLVGTVPADPSQWSDWDKWADHKRRYTKKAMEELLYAAGLEPAVQIWGWPLLRLYDGLFLRRVNTRRSRGSRAIEDDASLRTISSLGRRRWLVRLVKAIFSVDRLFDGAPWGIGLMFAARKCGRVATTATTPGLPSQSDNLSSR